MTRIGSSPAFARPDTASPGADASGGRPAALARGIGALTHPVVRPVPSPGRVAFAGASDVGKVRPHNEDAWCFDAALGLAVLADGMGGYNAGEVASGIAIETVRATVERALDTGRDASAALVEAVERANALVHDTARLRPECAGMGTTLVASLIEADRVAFVSIGDSRLYRWRAGALEQLSRDDTVVRQMRESGLGLVDGRTESHWHGVLTRAVGVDPELDVQAEEAALSAGDLLLLCSDGLTDMLDDASIATVLAAHQSSGAPAVAAALVEAAVHAGGIDNVTALVATAGAARTE